MGRTELTEAMSSVEFSFLWDSNVGTSLLADITSFTEGGGSIVEEAALLMSQRWEMGIIVLSEAKTDSCLIATAYGKCDENGNQVCW